MTARAPLLVGLVAVSALAVAPASSTRHPLPAASKIVVVVFENKAQGEVLGSGEAPTFDQLARRYATLAPYRAITHPSLPNYLALVAGSTFGIHDDCTDCVVDGRSLADSLETASRTWKVYAEGLPRPGFTGAQAGRYAKKHVPFLYFRSIADSPKRRARVVPLTQLARDLAAQRLPDFSLVVPDLCNDMHDCSVRTGDRWLARVVVPLLRNRQLARAVIFVVFDEDDHPLSVGERDGGLVPALALGPIVRRGSHPKAAVNHYGLLRTIEAIWGLPLLGRSAHATPIEGIWR